MQRLMRHAGRIGSDAAGAKEKRMNDYGHPYDEEGRAHDGQVWRDRLQAFLRWLKARPAESWLFLVAGVLIGRFFF